MSAESEVDVLPDEYRTGIPLIDHEHQRLHALIGNLRTICADFECKADCQGCAEEVVQRCEQQLLDVLSDVLAFMSEHFCTEEKLLRKSGMSAVERDLFESHVDEHVRLIQSISALTNVEQLYLTVSHIAETTAVLRRWLSDHIVRFDKPMLQ